MIELNIKIPIKLNKPPIIVNDYFYSLGASVNLSKEIIDRIATFSSVLRLFTDYPKVLFDENKTNLLMKFKIRLHSGSMFDDESFLERQLYLLNYELEHKYKDSVIIEELILI